MLRTFTVDRALVRDAERTRLSWSDPMSTHLDLQPAIAACRAASTASLSFRLHGLSRACSSVSFELRYTRFQPDPRLTLSPAAKGRRAMPRRTPSGSAAWVASASAVALGSASFSLLASAYKIQRPCGARPSLQFPGRNLPPEGSRTSMILLLSGRQSMPNVLKATLTIGILYTNMLSGKPFNR
jgi:hypothetical protein